MKSEPTTAERVTLEDLLPNAARIIYDSYPSSDLLPIDPEADCVNLQTLKEAAKNCGDPLFAFIVNEVDDAGSYAMSISYSSIEDRLERVFDRDRWDISDVEKGLSNALYRSSK